jgi:plastocyanin
MMRQSEALAVAALAVTCVLATAFMPSRAHVTAGGVQVVARGAGDVAARTHVIRIKAMGFEPASVTVAVGDTIIWRNADALSHTATSVPHGTDVKARFDSREIKPGATVRWVVRGRGQLDYICSFHPVMRGVVMVK